MTWGVEWTGPAARDMSRLDRDIARRVRQIVLRLADAGQGDVVKLRGYEGEWRLRVGDWRVRFTFERETHTIRVLRVLHRREAYRG